VRTSDIFVLIVGGRYGSTDDESGKSITNIEYDTAKETGMPIYIFVDKEVWTKRDTYKQLKAMVRDGDLSEEKINPALGGTIQDYKVYEFIEYIQSSHRNPWIFQFEQASEIIGQLQNNWSLLLKEYLVKKRGLKLLRPEAELMPLLVLRLLDSNENSVDSIYVPPLPFIDKKSLIEKLNSLKPSKRIIDLIEKRTTDIEMLITEREPSELGLSRKPKNPSDFVKYVNGFSRIIEECIDLLNLNFEAFRKRYRLKERVIKPQFDISSDGNCPAEEIVIYMEPSEKISFILEEKLNESALFVPDRIPESVSEVIKIAEKLDDLMKMPKKSKVLSLADLPERLPGVGGVYGESLLGSLSSYAIPSKAIDSLSYSSVEENIKLEGERVRIDFKKLKHLFHVHIKNEKIFLSCFLESGETEILEYTCYADNMPIPSRGILKVIAKNE